MSIVNLHGYSSIANCVSNGAALTGFGFSYSFDLDKCYLIAGPGVAPNFQMPTFVESLNGAPPGQFFKYSKVNNTLSIFMCTRDDCNTCNSPQPVLLNECISTDIGVTTYSYKTTFDDAAAFGFAPLSTDDVLQAAGKNSLAPEKENWEFFNAGSSSWSSAAFMAGVVVSVVSGVMMLV